MKYFLSAYIYVTCYMYIRLALTLYNFTFCYRERNHINILLSFLSFINLVLVCNACCMANENQNKVQSTLVISNSLISNNRLSRSENLVPVITQRSPNMQQNIVEKRRNCSLGAISPLFHNIFNISLT